MKLAQSEYTWSKKKIYQSAIMIHVVCVFLIRLKINRRQLRDWRLKRILWVMRLFRYVLLLRPLTRIWDQSSYAVLSQPSLVTRMIYIRCQVTLHFNYTHLQNSQLYVKSINLEIHRKIQGGDTQP